MRLVMRCDNSHILLYTGENIALCVRIRGTMTYHLSYLIHSLRDMWYTIHTVYNMHTMHIVLDMLHTQ